MPIPQFFTSVRLNGEAAYTIYSDGTVLEKFLDYLKNTPIPKLHEEDIVVMDICARIRPKRSRRFCRGLA